MALLQNGKRISPVELAAKLKNQRELARESPAGETFVAVVDHRDAQLDNGLRGQMIVVERYRIKGKSPRKAQ